MEKEIVHNKIGQNFSTIQLFVFSFPAFLTNTFTQLFKSLDDALFVSRYVGEKALAAMNLLTPILSLQLALSHLFSLGSSNISAKLMGEGKQEEAKQVFSKIIIGAGIVGTVCAILINIFARPLLKFLGADEVLAQYAIYSIRIVYGIEPISLINTVFAGYFATAGKPKMGTICSLVNGVTNIALDIILVAVLDMGVLGVCLATAIGEIVVFIIGFLFFCNVFNEIHFVKPIGDMIKPCLDSFKYALPQAINSASISLVMLITNYLLLSIIGSDGIAANAIIADIRAIITSGLIGIAASISPIIAYNYGNRNPIKLKKILYSVLKIWFFGSIVLVTIGYLARKPLISIYMSKDSSTLFYDMAMFGLTIEILAVPFLSGCVIISRILIALNDTKASTLLSIFRNLIIKIIVMLTLPTLFGQTGIWLAVPVGEFLSFCFGMTLIIINANNYGYGPSGQAKRLQ